MVRRRPNVAVAARRAASPEPGLAVHESAARVQALLHERTRLTREAQKKKLQLEQLRLRLANEAREAKASMMPVIERQRALVTRLVALFDELLAPGRLAKRARAHIAQLRRALEREGVLSPIDAWCEDEGENQADDQRERHSGHAHAHANPGGELAGARQVGQERRSLRELFRSLARSIHPDKAQHDRDRAERTELMKQVTRAYEEGDLARLVELENAWQSEQASEVGDPERRCRELERTNRELLDQVRALTRQLRDHRRAARDESMGLPPRELVERAKQELDDIEALCELLGQFRDGRSLSRT
ncbi:MAG TPA: hypothetical protein VEX18_08040 [Polyangiaceae bacterium]|nr:hypothetical protein [Polyangiaceae bacterium]